jgi:4-amino-4-deoxy-L-arabinose transferase-like glycosyltransferase
MVGVARAIDEAPRTRFRFDRGHVALAVAVVAKLALHVATNWRYGFHRDELYYVACGQHLDWGFVDHPPITPLVARVATALFGVSLPGLRLFPALAGALVLVLTWAIVRRLGGGVWAQCAALAATLFAPIYLGGNTLFQTVAFDQLLWVLAIFLVVRLLEGGDARLWLALGLVFGVALETKYTAVLFGAGVALGFLLTPARRHLRTIWPWLGLAIAVAVALPNLVWQLQHDLPTLEFIRNNNARVQEEQSRLGFLLDQLEIAGPASIPLVVAGWVYLWSDRGRRMRALAWASLFVFVALVALGGKSYYPGPLYTLLFAAGAVRLEPFFVGQRRWIQATAAAIFLLLLLPPLFVILPVFSEHAMAKRRLYDVNGDLGEMVGWPEFVATVEGVVATLGPRERVRIFTASYGDAAALDYLGDPARLAPVISAHNSYIYWTSPGVDAGTYVLTGYSRGWAERHFDEVADAAFVSNALGVENESFGERILVCRRPKIPFSRLWSELKHFD